MSLPTSKEQTLIATYTAMPTSEIERRLDSGELAPLAEQIARAVLERRQVQKDVNPNPAPVNAPASLGMTNEKPSIPDVAGLSNDEQRYGIAVSSHSTHMINTDKHNVIIGRLGWLCICSGILWLPLGFGAVLMHYSSDAKAFMTFAILFTIFFASLTAPALAKKMVDEGHIKTAYAIVILPMGVVVTPYLYFFLF